jgi:adenylate cyclase
VDGSYRHVGENIRITTRLTDTGSGEILWQDAFDRHREESLELAQEISLTIAAHLEPQLSLAELRRHDRARPRELETWEIIRRADALCRVRGWHPDVLAEAVELLDKAIEREPEMALPEAMKSVLLGVGNRLALWLDPSDARRAAVASAERALALDDTDSQVLGYVGCALADFHQTERAMVILDRALEFDATNAQAWAARALALSDLRKYDAAIADGLTSLRLSPKDNRLAGWLLGHAAILLKAGDLEEAGKYADLSRRRDPRHFGAWLLLGLIRFLRGDTDAAREPIAESLRLRPDLTFAHLERFLGAQAAGALRQAGLVPPGAD